MSLPRKKNLEAKELVSSSQQMLQDIDEKLIKADDRVSSLIEEHTAEILKDIDIELKKFDERYLNVQNALFSGSEITYTDIEPEDISGKFYASIEAIDPIKVKRFSSGVGMAIMLGLVVSLMVSIALILFVLSAYKIPLQFSSIEALLMGISDMIGGVENANMGLAVLATMFIVPAVVISIFYYFKRASSNIKYAKSVFTDASSQHLELSSQLRKKENLAEYLESHHRCSRALTLFLDEYNAKMRRIVYVEGSDYQEYAEESKADIRVAVELYRALKLLISTKIVSLDGTILEGALKVEQDAATLQTKMMAPYAALKR